MDRVQFVRTSIATLRFRSMRTLRRCVVSSGLPRLRWRLLPWGLYCFIFHRIGDASKCAFDRELFSCSTQQFEDVVRLLKEKFEIISLNDLLDPRALRARTRRPVALITFDDGYRDNFDEAFPILQQHGVSALFFLPTGFIGENAVPWWDEIAWCVRNATVPEIRPSGAARGVSLADGHVERAIRSLLQIVTARRHVPINDSVSEIRQLTCCPPRQTMLAESPGFMSWSDVHTLVRAGMDIGSHTHSHRILAHLSEEEQEHELVYSKATIESNIGRDVIAVAYPVGGQDTFTQATVRLAKSAGYRFGFSFRRGIAGVPPTDPLTIPRHGVSGLRSCDRLMQRVAFPRLGF